MTGLRIEVVQRPGLDLLRQIGHLRVRAWATEIPEAAEMDEWLDRWENEGWHWLVYQGDELVAAARLSIHQALDEVPDRECFEGVFAEAPPAPLASLNRLVVAPSARGLGLSRRLDELRLDFAKAQGCRCAIGSTPMEHRVKQLVELGFVVVGLGNRDHSPPCCYGPRPVVIACRLPRRQAE
jgi:GNAT superfamily N-acetyltransferase